MADQLAPQWLALADTPHLDALAARGTVFQNAYCNSPICAPSRASMCTGRLVSNIGAYDNGADFPAGTPTFMDILAESGYDTWLSGKMHFIGPDQHRGFQRRLTPEIYPSTHTWTPDWNESPVPNPGTAVDQLSTAGRCTWNLQLDYDEEVSFRALEALRDQARRQEAPGANPFLLCASFTQPHEPFLTTQDQWDRYDHGQIPRPEAPAQPLEEMHPYNQWLQVHHMVDQHPPTDDQVRNARHAYFGMVSDFDDRVGALLSELDRLGLSGNTVIVVTADHGEMLGEHGMWFKRTFFEESTRVPLIIAGPKNHPRKIATAVSLLDLFPTFQDLAQANLETTIDGRSLAPLLHNSEAEDSDRDPVLIEYLSEGACQPMRAAVQDRLKYVHVAGEKELLFDLRNDPHERLNLFTLPAYAERLETLRTFLHRDYDPEQIREDILASQQRRRAAHAANPNPGWDVAPDFDPSQQYVRRQNAQVTNIERRFPKV